MPKTYLEALANAAAQVKKASQDWTGWCLKFCRIMYGVAALYTEADLAWDKAKYRHTTGVPPKGALVFWRVGKFGHIAISDGGGYVYSTDIMRRGKVDRVPITYVTSHWRATYLGWTEDINGVRVITVAVPKAPPRVSLKALQYHAAHGTGKYSPANSADMVAMVKKRLVNVGFGKDSNSFATCYQLWQKHLGYSGKAADGIPGLTTLKVLARNSGWTIVS